MCTDWTHYHSCHHVTHEYHQCHRKERYKESREGMGSLRRVGTNILDIVNPLAQSPTFCATTHNKKDVPRKCDACLEFEREYARWDAEREGFRAQLDDAQMPRTAPTPAPAPYGTIRQPDDAVSPVSHRESPHGAVSAASRHLADPFRSRAVSFGHVTKQPSRPVHYHLWDDDEDVPLIQPVPPPKYALRSAPEAKPTLKKARTSRFEEMLGDGSPPPPMPSSSSLARNGIPTRFEDFLGKRHLPTSDPVPQRGARNQPRRLSKTKVRSAGPRFEKLDSPSTPLPKSPLDRLVSKTKRAMTGLTKGGDKEQGPDLFPVKGVPVSGKPDIPGGYI